MGVAWVSGGESGIRTHGTVLPYTRFPSVRLKPLGHLSGAHVLPARAAFFKGKARMTGGQAGSEAAADDRGFSFSIRLLRLIDRVSLSLLGRRP